MLHFVQYLIRFVRFYECSIVKVYNGNVISMMVAILMMMMMMNS